MQKLLVSTRAVIVLGALALLSACGGSGSDGGTVNITCFNVGATDQFCYGAGGDLVAPAPCSVVVDGNDGNPIVTPGNCDNSTNIVAPTPTVEE